MCLDIVSELVSDVGPCLEIKDQVNKLLLLLIKFLHFIYHDSFSVYFVHRSHLGYVYGFGQSIDDNKCWLQERTVLYKNKIILASKEISIRRSSKHSQVIGASYHVKVPLIVEVLSDELRHCLSVEIIFFKLNDTFLFFK
jgi:hypothetical protein